MPPSELRKEAREALAGRWGKGVCIVLAYLLFSFVVGFIGGLIGEESLLYSIIDLAYSIISVAFSFGLVVCFIKLKRGEDVNAFGYITDGFSRFSKAWGIALWTLVKMLLPIICLILIIILLTGTIIYGAASGNAFLTIAITALFIATLIYSVSRGLLYVLAYCISYDNPELSSKECVSKSEALMKGNRGNYFLLQLSFIGWAILAVLSFGIGMLWLMPYMAVAEVCFYDRIAKPETKKVEEAVKIEE